MTKIDIITRTSKFEELKEALHDIGIAGMTVTSVLGCGMQKGITETYRGVPLNINLLPKVKLEIVVKETEVERVIQTSKEVLKTGQIGDGKIFLYPVENVIRIRTGEEGNSAL